VKLLGSGASVDMALVSKFKAEDGKTLRQLIGDVHGWGVSCTGIWDPAA
jgi:hypothetical protein